MELREMHLVGLCDLYHLSRAGEGTAEEMQIDVCGGSVSKLILSMSRMLVSAMIGSAWVGSAVSNWPALFASVRVCTRAVGMWFHHLTMMTAISRTMMTVMLSRTLSYGGYAPVGILWVEIVISQLDAARPT
ncbi:hypothetical protein EDB85DRAFT_2005823 [Lactarius pseudohatsudake]|nr:hypothetical protein EDB85DRAFT_2005823 [Lactarius pseudohatsudake]